MKRSSKEAKDEMKDDAEEIGDSHKRSSEKHLPHGSLHSRLWGMLQRPV